MGNGNIVLLCCVRFKVLIPKYNQCKWHFIRSIFTFESCLNIKGTYRRNVLKSQSLFWSFRRERDGEFKRQWPIFHITHPSVESPSSGTWESGITFSMRFWSGCSKVGLLSVRSRTLSKAGLELVNGKSHLRPAFVVYLIRAALFLQQNL